MLQTFISTLPINSVGVETVLCFFQGGGQDCNIKQHPSPRPKINNLTFANFPAPFPFSLVPPFKFKYLSMRIIEQDRSKPGRQVVTFLLICNLAIWVIYTFEVQKVEESPVQVQRRHSLTSLGPRKSSDHRFCPEFSRLSPLTP